MASAPVTQPQAGQVHASWLDLPPEMRIEILNLVSQDSQHHQLSLYATVCSEWQYFFETITFRHLLVDSTALEDFSRIMSGKNARRTGNLRHMLFLIVLPRYSCPSCHELESRFEIYRNNRIFTTAVEVLLGMLSTWVPRGRSGGLTLELGIKSPSDTRHYYRDITMYNNYPFRSWDNLDETIDMTFYHMSPKLYSVIDARPKHAHSARLALRRPEGFHAAGRFLGSLLQFQGLKNSHLPRVKVINSLLIRHQFKRQMSPLALAKLVHESLVHITSFRLERWCRITNEEEEKYLKDFRHLLSFMPESLESFHYFAENLKRPTPAQTKPLSAMELLYGYGHPFKEISVVEPSGTENWLAEMQRISANAPTKPLLPAQWHKLERICFRSGILRHDNDLGLINRLLLLTAPVAEKLPNLRSLEIFNTSTDSFGELELPSCLFRYSVQHTDATLLWESYWQLPPNTTTAAFEFCPQVKCAWEKVAVAHTGHSITIRINEPKEQTPNEVTLRQQFWSRGKPRLAEVFKLDAIHPFSRVLMRLNNNRALFR
ncbi:hypothetical protein QQS21_012256 [Conoideocrella luteorostrata]|uniref:DUF6546 domain-containing protein n=1 Tax=Conoideocrella luteorostrata TaxID=1105319 RepID=A0AAJ0FSV6_9HYPO|nr:hypothetical protein QQS21_012256 [Conoideocrella luteorostrata]